MTNYLSLNKTKIFFIGGIHGSGKGTICHSIHSLLKIDYLSASNLLKWEEISTKTNKMVDDFSLTQNRLLKGLKVKLKPNHTYLLDGHCCLFNSNGLPEKIPKNIFNFTSVHLK